MDDSRGDLIDAIVVIDRLISSLTATRAELIDGTRTWIETAEAIGRRPGRHGWNDAKVARRVLVSELAVALHISEREAGRLAFESETLITEMPATLEVLRTGRISYRHAAILVDQAWSLPPEAREPFGAALLPQAETLGVGSFARLARRHREAAHPESPVTRRKSAFERRSVSIEAAHDGMAWLTAYLPAELAVGIDDRLDRIAAAILGPGEERTFAQLRADSFAELVLEGGLSGGGRSRNGRDGGRGRAIRAQVLVTVPVLTLLGRSDEPAQLEGYGPIDAGTARQLAGDSTGFTRILTHPETGAVLSVGRTRYSVPAELRRAVRSRDGTCRMVGCCRRATSCDIDHTDDWQLGGGTGADNLAHLCRSHHQLKHRTSWSMTQRGGGVIEWTSPTGRVYTTAPVHQLPRALHGHQAHVIEPGVGCGASSSMRPLVRCAC
ncbi:MAG: HNH endonuclease [Actinomycetota bacterium]|nr:HNH endonuclease [Actinomycetota bacterium]